MIFLLVMLISIIFVPCNIQAQTVNQPSRAIHIVYDDSGSMIRVGGVFGNGPFLDRWCQAKYAMEVFAVMLQERDTMQVYYMSDYVRNANTQHRVRILGSEPVSLRVSQIRDTITNASDTPFASVTKAYNDLKLTTVDEKWLVILTDGMFNGMTATELDGTLFRYANESDVNIIFLTIGDDVGFNQVSSGYFYEHAASSNEILGRITSICNRIFNRNSLGFGNEAKREFKFDLPMLEILVFAQGENVSVNGISGSGSYNPNESVNVRYSEAAALGLENNPNVIIARNLKGVIALFQNVPKGNYGLDISEAQTVEIYYKPAVNVAIRLRQNGRVVSPNEIFEGRYKVEFGIVDENGRFFESSLLGNVAYEAVLQNNGQTTSIRSGDTIDINEGNFTVIVKAHFLDINTAENSISGSVLPPLPWQQRLINLIKQFWFIFCLLLALLLFWLLWGRKKKFPKKIMERSPTITKEGDKNNKTGEFYIKPHTVWLPFCAWEGTIRAVPSKKALPRLEVRAVDKSIMELTNADAFEPGKLRVARVKIGKPILDGTPKIIEISCSATIETTFQSRGESSTEVYKCFLERRGK